jgi:hypothetical protein
MTLNTREVKYAEHPRVPAAGLVLGGAAIAAPAAPSRDELAITAIENAMAVAQ